MSGFFDWFERHVWHPLMERLGAAGASPKVAVLPLHGVIGHAGRGRGQGMTAASLEEAIEKAFSLRGARAVALAINSPGGSPVQSALIYKQIRYWAKEKGLPVFAFAEDVAASGGYWLACAGDEIFAEEASIVGSIGVVAGGFGLQDFIKRHGIERRLYTQGENKAMLDPFLPEKPEDVARLKEVQKDVHESFKALVKERRGEKLAQENKELFSGAFWSGKQALALGLVDGLGDLHGILRERFGDKLVFKTIPTHKSWLARRLGLSRAAHTPEAWVEGALAVAEERAEWMRFGL